LNWMEFGMFGAIFLAGVIGLERQWQQRTMGLRTNGLVAIGSAMFIMMGLRAEAGVTAISWERSRLTPRMHPLQQARKRFAPDRGGGSSNVCRARALPSIDQKRKRLLSHEFDHSPITDWSLVVGNGLEVGHE
jgi:hypothetical protein